MSQDLSRTITRAAVDVTLSGTPDNLTQVLLPKNFPGGLKVTAYARTTAAYLTYTGTDGAAVGSAVKIPLPADTYVLLDPIDYQGTTPPEIYLGSSTASQVVLLVIGRQP